MTRQVAIVLSGGGSKGDFEVGALRYLYEIGIRPQIVAGSSVGAINALKLVEGDDPSPAPNQAQKLEEIWRGLTGDHDMFQLEPWLQTIEDTRIREIFSRSLPQGGVHGASAVAAWLRLPVRLVYGLVSSGIEISDITDAVERASRARSVMNLSPVERLIRKPEVFDPTRARASGIKLRLAVVGLGSGALHHVTEAGEILGTEGEVVDLIDAAIASASIPVVFPPRKLGNDYYVDGGIREALPMQAALDAGATEIYAITATQPTAPLGSFEDATLMDIGMRAVGDIMVDEITAGDLRPVLHSAFDVPMTLIRPTLEIHDIITIDRGLIDISLGYGYMRAADHLSAGEDERVRWMELSDRISRLRLECWTVEQSFVRDRRRRILSQGDRSNLASLRALKRRVYEAVEERHALGAPVPEGAEAWWREWEQHIWDPPAASPWDRFSTTFGPLPAETPPGSGL